MRLSRQLGGRKVVEVWKNDITLVIKCEDGFEMVVGWRDANGNPIKGEPVIVSAGKRIIANTSEVMHRNEVGLR